MPVTSVIVKPAYLAGETSSMLPHCQSCTCRAPVPDQFTSDVRLLPVDLDRVYTYTVGRGSDLRHEHDLALDNVSWVPERRRTMRQRVSYYRYLLDEGICDNPREAVKMTTVKRRVWETEETERHATRLARSPRFRCRDGYERSLAFKKRLILAEGADCAYCGLPNPQTVDHLVPLARRRDHRRRNLTPACWPCNQEKGNRTPREWRDARLAAGLPWPPEQRDQNQRTFPGTLPRKRTPFSRSVEEADPS